MTTATTPDLGSIQTASPYILIVDDAAGHIELMRDAFASSPLKTEICTATRIDEARARISERMPDLVICDLFLPDGDGVHLLPAGERETAPTHWPNPTPGWSDSTSWRSDERIE
jgi:DNA-binding NtrC family response regulator